MGGRGSFIELLKNDETSMATALRIFQSYNTMQTTIASTRQ